MKARTRVNLAATPFFILLVLFFLAVGGWIMNIVKMIDLVAADGAVTAMLVGRVVGVVIAPVGAILGFF